MLVPPPICTCVPLTNIELVAGLTPLKLEVFVSIRTLSSPAGNAVYGSDPTNALPAGELNVRIDTKTSNFKGVSPATSSMFVNGTQVQIGGGTNISLLKQTGFRNNYITLEGIGDGLIHTFDNVKISALACIKASLLDVITPRGQSNATVTVTVPIALNLTNA